MESDLTAVQEQELLQIEQGYVPAIDSNIVEQITRWISDNKTPANVLETVTEVVIKLFAQVEIKEALNKEPRPLMDALFTCIKNNLNSTIILKNALTAIGNIIVALDPNQTWLVEDYDAINIVVDILKKSKLLPDVQAQAYYALQNLAMGNETNVHLLMDTYGATELVHESVTAHPLHIPLITQAFALLRRMTFIKSTNARLMQSSCTLVMDFMLRFPTETEILQHCCAFINNIARDDQNKLELLSKKYSAHTVILSVMRSHPFAPAVQENACGAIWNFALNNDDKQLIKEPHFAHEAVLVAMRTHPTNALIQERGSAALWNLFHMFDDPTIYLERNIHVTVVAALRAHPQHEQAQIFGVMLMSTLMLHPRSTAVCESHDVLPLCELALRNFPQNSYLTLSVDKMLAVCKMRSLIQDIQDS